MTDEYEKAVERRARAICRVWGEKAATKLLEQGRATATDLAHANNRLVESNWQQFVPEARATLDDDDAAGFALVPKEPTEAVVDIAKAALDNIASGHACLPGYSISDAAAEARAAIAAIAIRRNEK